MRIVHLSVALLLTLALAPVSGAAISLVSASRIAGDPAFTGFGPYTNSVSQTLNAGTPSFPNGMVFTSVSQTSDIQLSGVTFTSTVSAAVVNTAPQTFAISTSSLTLVFTITGAPQDFSYAWSSAPTSQAVRITNSANIDTFLSTGGATLFSTLQPGQYTLSIQNQTGAVASAPSNSSTITGSIAFIPAPGVAATLLLPIGGVLSARRRRRN
jgi:hypothetical protein